MHTPRLSYLDSVGAGFWRYLICISRLRPAHIAGGQSLCVDDTAEFTLETVEPLRFKMNSNMRSSWNSFSRCRSLLTPPVNQGHLLQRTWQMKVWCVNKKLWRKMKWFSVIAASFIITGFFFLSPFEKKKYFWWWPLRYMTYNSREISLSLPTVWSRMPTGSHVGLLLE